MLDPFHIAGHDILSAELASFPILTSLQSAHALTNMLIELVNAKDNSALPALLVMSAINAISQQVINDFSEVNSSHTLFATDQNFALPQQMLSLIHTFHVHETVVAFTTFLIMLFFFVLKRLILVRLLVLMSVVSLVWFLLLFIFENVQIFLLLFLLQL